MQPYIRVRGAREHNLQNIDVDLPRDALVVLTGLSGSGKSSLAFDTLYAEGQRRYVESLSSYARQFLGQMEKPDVDSIEGLSPAISIDQKTTSRNPRSTVGTVTEIYDYLRLLYARVGTPHCPKCGKPIEQTSLDQIVDSVLQAPVGARLIILAPVVRDRKGEFQRLFADLLQKGFVRVRIDGTLETLSDELKLTKTHKHTIEVVVDRLVVREGIRSRLADSLEIALRLTEGVVEVETGLEQTPGSRDFEYTSKLYSQKFSCPDCEISIGEISTRLFSFNNPLGACPTCSGLGQQMYMDEALVVTDPSKSLDSGAIHSGGWNFDDPTSWASAHLEALVKRYGIDPTKPWDQLPREHQKLILYGNDGEKLAVDTSRSRYRRKHNYKAVWEGVIPSLTRRYAETANPEMKAYYEQYMAVNPCPTCHGARLKPEGLAVTVGGLNIYELTQLPIDEAMRFLKQIDWSTRDRQIADPILREVESRLRFLIDVGLHYMTLSRASSTLSGGEAQRIRLATQIGSGLMGVLYILDEPSIGLHQRDNARLLKTLQRLRNLGNTVLVVEHDEETMWAADHIVDLGPGAGEEGGQIVAEGRLEAILENPASLTGQYLSGQRQIAIPSTRRPGNGQRLVIYGAREHNLQNIDVSIPLGTLTCVTGVSGSGKSSLINGILLPKLEMALQGSRRKVGTHRRVLGLEHLDKVIAIDQSPIGRTPRSNPVTYTGTFDLIRTLFSQTPAARAKGYKPGRFSFNVKGGRCEACGGDGVNRIEMHFLPDLYVPCEVCKGKRYNRETLSVHYKGLSIADVLDLTVREAVNFFQDQPRILRKLETLQQVGLGYIRLGQPSTQLSGGEAQRIKLATELSKRSTGKTLYILDEPTTGLHLADVHKLVEILHALVEAGNTVVVIEHNLDVIKTADYLLDLGPEGGSGGGQLIASGTPEAVAAVEDSYTGQYLKAILAGQNPYRRNV